jgi:tetratricopeptide (TPR) repeat protein
MRSALFGVLLLALAAASPAQELLEQQRRDQARQRYRAGQELMLGESFEEAAREFRAATELDPGFVLAHYSLGQALMALKRYPGALQAYTICHDTILRQASLNQRGRAELDQRRRDEIHELEDSLQRVRLGKIKNAALGQEVVLEERLRVLRDAGLRGAEQTGGVPAELSLALGSAHFRLGRLENAEQEYRAAIAADRRMGAAHNNLAVIFMMTGRLDEANREVQAAEKAGFTVSARFKQDLKERQAAARTKP